MHFSRHSNVTFPLWTGWDTDQFMTDIAEATLVMSSVVKNVSGMNQLSFLFKSEVACLLPVLVILLYSRKCSNINMVALIILLLWVCQQGGLAPGGFNFDAKLLVHIVVDFCSVTDLSFK